MICKHTEFFKIFHQFFSPIFSSGSPHFLLPKMVFYGDFRHNEDMWKFLTYYKTELATFSHLTGSQQCEHFNLYLHSSWDTKEWYEEFENFAPPRSSPHQQPYANTFASHSVHPHQLSLKSPNSIPLIVSTATTIPYETSTSTPSTTMIRHDEHQNTASTPTVNLTQHDNHAPISTKPTTTTFINQMKPRATNSCLTAPSPTTKVMGCPRSWSQPPPPHHPTTSQLGNHH